MQDGPVGAGFDSPSHTYLSSLARHCLQKKCIWGPATKNEVTVGSLFPCNRQVLWVLLGPTGPKLSVPFRHQYLSLWAPGICARHHSHRVTQQISSTVLCFVYPERANIFFKPSLIWTAEKLKVAGSCFPRSWDLSLNGRSSMDICCIN